MRRNLIFLVLLFAAATLRAEQPSVFFPSPPEPEGKILASLLSSETRGIVALDGPWEYSEDGEDWEPVNIPACYIESGHFFLRRNFSLPSSMLDRFRWEIVGFGLQYSGSIELNGQFIVQREGLIPFRAPIPEEVALGEKNTIVIEIDNQLAYGATLPGRRMSLDVKTYGGILRNLLLVGTPQVWIDDVRIIHGADGKVSFDVDVISGAIDGLRLRNGTDSAGNPIGGTISGDKATFDVGVSLIAPRISDTVEPGRYGQVQQTVSIQSKRTQTVRLNLSEPLQTAWSPANPDRYQAIVEIRYNGVVIDEDPIWLGRGRLTREGSKLLLNDSVVKLKGVVYIEDSEKYGASLPYAQMRADLQEIRDMGANLIRFSGGVPHPYLLSLCDELGFLAFIDIPIGSSPSTFFDTDDVIERSVQRAEATIVTTRGFTSVVGYGIGFPVGFDTEASVPLVGTIRTIIDSMAPGRLLYSVSNDWKGGELTELVDIVGVSQLDGEVQSLADLLRRTLTAVASKRPVVVLGFGRLVRIGNQSGYSDATSTQAQAKYIGEVVTILEKEDVAGYVYWAFNDYRTDRPLLTVDNADQYVASCGLTTLDRSMRIAGKTLGALYTDQKPPDLAIGEYSAPSTVLFIAVGIVCALVFLLLINNSRRFRENVFRALLRPYNFYADIRDQRILSTLETSLLAFVIAATFAVIFASLFYFYRMEEPFDFMLSAVVTSDGLKETLNYMIWRPAVAVAGFTAFFFVGLLLVAMIIRLCSFFVRNRIFFSDAYTIAVWGALPVLLLIPLAMVLYRILELPAAGPVAFTIVFLVLLWMLYRVLRGTAVIFDVPAPRVYLYGLGSIFALLIILFFTSSNAATVISYLLDGIGSVYGIS